MPRPKRERVIHIGLYKQEASIVQRIEEDGFELSEIIRGIIRDYGKENYPPDPDYVAVQRERLALKKSKIEQEQELEDMSPEDYVKKILKARVVDYEGKRKVEFKRGTGQSVYAPLENIKAITPDNNSLAGIHMELVNREFVFASGNAPTEEQYEKMFEGWDLEN